VPYAAGPSTASLRLFPGPQQLDGERPQGEVFKNSVSNHNLLYRMSERNCLCRGKVWKEAFCIDREPAINGVACRNMFSILVYVTDMKLPIYLIMLGLTTVRIFGCSCAGGVTTCGSLTSAKIAFVGTVIQGSEPEDGHERRGFGTSVAVVKVETIVRGLDKGVLEIKVNPSVGTSCYFPMRSGERWLIFGGYLGENVFTGGCSGSRLISPTDVTVERMVDSFLRGPNLFLGEVRIYKGWDSPWRTDNLMSGVEIVLSREGKKWSTRTDQAGHFEVQGLPAEEYDLDVKSPGMSFERPEDSGESRFDQGVSSKVLMTSSGCVQAPLILWPDQGISGAVRGFDAKPLAGINVSAYKLDEQGRPSRVSARTATTNDEGRYLLPRLMNGNYIVGVNANWAVDKGPYAMKYHPAAGSPLSATIIVLEGKTLNNIDISLDPPRKLADVTVRVVFADGKPASSALVSVERDDKGRLWGDARNPSASFTDNAGLLKVALYDGDQYVLSASWTEYDKPSFPLRTKATAESNRVRVIAGRGAVANVVLANPTPKLAPTAPHQ
jgi:hypothetical protein